MRQFFKSKEQTKASNKRSRVEQAAKRRNIRLQNEKMIVDFLRTREGKEQLDKFRAIGIISTRASLDYAIIHDKYEQYLTWLGD